MLESPVHFPGTRSRPEVDLLLSCARTQVTPEISDRIRTLVKKQVDWIELIRLAMRHDVMTLLYRNLQQVCPDSVPENILGPLGARHRERAREAQRRVEALVRITSLFEEQGILAVPYKGPALAQRLYGDLSLRGFGDLDIMILERDVPRAKELTQLLGYEVMFLNDTVQLAEHVRANRELIFSNPSDGAQLELHWRFALQSLCVKDDPGRFLQYFERIGLGGSQVLSLPLEVYLLILSLHATKHKWRQLKLICDIAEILGHNSVDWNYVIREAHDLGLERMLAVGVLLAEAPLEAVIPAELARGLQIDHTARALAAQVRRSLFTEPDEDWSAHADFYFQVKIRERLRDKASMLHRNLPSILAPNERDRQFLSIPEQLSTLYYFVKPFRWAWEKMNTR
jgi:hypothetical protein